MKLLPRPLKILTIGLLIVAGIELITLGIWFSSLRGVLTLNDARLVLSTVMRLGAFIALYVLTAWGVVLRKAWGFRLVHISLLILGCFVAYVAIAGFQRHPVINLATCLLITMVVQKILDYFDQTEIKYLFGLEIK